MDEPVQDAFGHASRVLLDRLAVLAPWDVWCVVRRTTDEQWQVLHATDHPFGDELDIERPWATSLCSRRVAGAPMVTSCLPDEPGYADLPAVADHGLHSYAGLPVHAADGSVFGTVCGYDRETKQLDDQARHVLEVGVGLLQDVLHLQDELDAGRRQRAAAAAAVPGAAPVTPDPAGLGGPSMLLGGHAADEAEGGASIEALLERSRRHLGLDVLFVGRWEDGQRHFEYVSAEGPLRDQLVGTAQPLEETYCLPIVRGEVPRAIPDAQVEPSVQDIGLTHDFGIGAHVGVPLHLPDGEQYGTICGASFTADQTINERDASFLEFVTEVVGAELHRSQGARIARERLAVSVRGLLADGDPRIVLQPIVRLADGVVVGHEALSRFVDTTVGPDVWFDRAERAGLGLELEMAAIERALELVDRLPVGTYLTVNANPDVARSVQLRAALARVDASRVVVELTEHLDLVTDEGWHETMAQLRATGARLAVDDAGAGHSGLQRLLDVRPDVIKIDRSIVAGVAGDAARAAMVTALRDFAGATGADLVAEGIEDDDDLQALLDLDVANGQGFGLGRPAPPAEWFGEAPPAAA